MIDMDCYKGKTNAKIKAVTIGRNNEIHKRNISRLASIYIHNCLTNSLISFNPLCKHIPHKITHDLDNYVTNSIKHKFGLTQTDAPHIMYLPHNLLGQNIKSFALTQIQSLTREIEVHLNSPTHINAYSLKSAT